MVLSVLFVNDEWLPTSGGISVVNRELATEVARLGHRVACLVRSPSTAELTDAADRGVVLFGAPDTPAGPELLVPAAEVLGLRPDVVLGHDRISGVAAWSYARRYLGTRLVHLVHTAPAEIERFKPRGAATQRIEERERITRRIARDADILAAIGPRLARHTASAVVEHGHSVSVLRLDPGVREVPVGRRTPPERPIVLVLGRTSDVALKGLDVAVHAVGALPRRLGLPRTGLLVRGAHPTVCDELHAELIAGSGLSGELLDVRPFVGDADETVRDIVRATVCLMPSRVEGFGLTALEAIGAATPVLVSARSGLAEVLHEHLGTMAAPMVVDVTGDLVRDAAAWAEAVQRVLDDPIAGFAHAAEVLAKLAPRLTWSNTAATLLDRIAAL